MKNINKNVVPATMAVLVVFSMFAPAFVSVANAASFGTGPFDVIEGFNYSDQGSGNHWQQNSANAGAGETVSVRVYVKNNSSETANNVRVRLSTSAGGDSGTITATISADNASNKTGSFEVNLDGSGNLDSLSHTGYTKVYNAFLTQQSFSGSASDVAGSGIGLGDIAPGDPNSKFVIADFEVNGGESNNGDKPEVTTRSATDVNSDDARLRGEVDPNGLDTEVWFEWGQGFFSLTEDTPKEDIGDGTSVSDFDFVIDNLEEDETYYFRAVARNSEGTDYGNVLSFRTGDDGGDGPEITDVDTDDIDDNSAVLVCEVEPNGEDTDVWFEWSDDEDEVEDGDGDETNTVDVDEDESSETVRITITGLDEDTDYFFKCFAENTDGDDESGIEEFTTDENGGGGDEPDVTTLSATGITTASAVIRGEVDPNGEETDVWFEWGTSSTNLNRETSAEDAGDGTNDVDFDRTITGLSANTTYFYRAVAESNEGIDRGNILSFRTNTVAPPTVLTQFIERIVEREPEPEPEGLIITLDVDTTNIDSDEIRYTVSYENLTDETFTNAELIVEIPDELEFIDADPTEDDEDGDNLFFTIGTISPGEEDSFVIDTEIANNVDENDEILFVANVEYTDSGTRKIVTAKHNMTLAEARNGGGFGAFIGGAFADFLTNPLLWLLILLLVIFFVYRYFANLARPKEAPVYIREPFPPATSGDDS